MKIPFNSSLFPENSLFLLCSNHEERCLGIVGDEDEVWYPRRSIVFKYKNTNQQGEMHHIDIITRLKNRSAIAEISFDEHRIIENFNHHRQILRSLLIEHGDNPIVVDVSALTKRHFLLLLRWLDDHDCWERLWIVYSEPEKYEIEGYLPLSFGISSVAPLPGFTASPNPSRPLHAVMFLGYEGDRAFATYEILQPKKTTVIIPDPPFRETWKGRTEEQNRNLLSAIDDRYSVERADAIDPLSSMEILQKICNDDTNSRSEFSRTLCPLGTKPQALGAYMYLRQCTDPPSVIYSRVLRPNRRYYSHGIGNRWLIYQPNRSQCE